MADPTLEPRTGLYRIRPYFQGKRLSVSLETSDFDEARLAASEVQKRIWAIEKGLAQIPPDCDPVEFVKTGGLRPNLGRKLLTEVIEGYRAATPDGSKAKTTQTTEEIHFRHLTRFFTDRTTLADLTPERVQKYVTHRLGQKYNGRPVSGPTIRKELVTLRMLWTFAERMKWVGGPCPAASIKLPKESSKEPYLTLGEIKRQVEGLDESDPGRKRLWARCVLVGKEIVGLTEHVRKINNPPTLFPMVAAAFLTGMRRSELCRSQVTDWDFTTGQVRVRERKRKHSKADSYRWVDLNRDLIEILEAYLKAGHPGGRLMFCERPDDQISPDRADDLWDFATQKSPYQYLSGWHCARHSFRSNLTSLGVSSALIDSYMGHTTDEQRERYTHFFPRDRKRAIDRLSFVTKS